MLYSEKYPNAKSGQEVETNILCGNTSDNCVQCGRMTKFVEMNYQAHFCSPECIEEYDSQVFRNALRI